MSTPPVLAVVAPLRLTFWVPAIATAVIVVVIAVGVLRHLASVRADRRRDHVRDELGPVFARFLLFEALEPLVEVLGFAIVIALIIEDSVNWTYLVAFFLVAVLTGQVLSTSSLLIEEIGFRRYRALDLARLTLWGLVEALWFRPALAWWRLKATVLALIGRRPGWGTIPRGEAILERPAHVVPPLTR
jgi:hypothetical protein